MYSFNSTWQIYLLKASFPRDFECFWFTIWNTMSILGGESGDRVRDFLWVDWGLVYYWYERQLAFPLLFETCQFPWWFHVHGKFAKYLKKKESERISNSKFFIQKHIFSQSIYSFADSERFVFEVRIKFLRNYGFFSKLKIVCCQWQLIPKFVSLGVIESINKEGVGDHWRWPGPGGFIKGLN